uniref:Uncharacterized protein n=1 Tax=Brassica campestris TaxID=3711 RepID=M4F7R0_BRACM
MDLCTDSPDASIPIQGPSFMPRRLQFVNSSSTFMSLAEELLIVYNNNFDIGVRSVRDIKEDTVARLPQSSRVVNKEAKRLSG